MSDLTATISYSATGSMVAIEQAGSYEPVAIARPDFDENPMTVLRQLGYRLAVPAQRSSLSRTMKATGYAKLSVVPTS